MEANAGKSFQMQIIFNIYPAVAAIATKFQSNTKNTNMVY